MVGQVIRVISGFYDIESNEKIYRVRGSGNLRNLDMQILVGDFVEFEPNGLLTSIKERKNFLIRPKVANLDQAIIVMSLKEPDFSSLLLDKFLTIINFCKIKPIIFFTKIDLSNNDKTKEYEKFGYETYYINSLSSNNSNLDNIVNIFRNKNSVLMGQSGVGKSTLINHLFNLNQATQAISKNLGRGKHTTRVVERINWDGGMVVDTPGFSSFELPLEKKDIAISFHNFFTLSFKCRYRTCLHITEDEQTCEVKRQLVSGQLDQEIYNNYQKLIKEAK